MANSFDVIDLNGKKSHRVLRFTHEAMATVFSIMIIHEDEEYAHQAVTAAWAECDRLENELSRFIENSDISRLNLLPVNQSTIISVDTYECLIKCNELTAATMGAFDVTLGTSAPIPKLGASPPFVFNPENYSVTRLHPDAQIDLGGFAKGYTVDKIGELLEEWEIAVALISGGRSSVLALDPPPGEEGWEVTITHPLTGDVIKKLMLRNQCLSGSGLVKGDHIINPSTGNPVKGRIAAWSLCPNASEGDALSTAFMVLDEEQVRAYCVERETYRAVIVRGDSSVFELI